MVLRHIFYSTGKAEKVVLVVVVAIAVPAAVNKKFNGHVQGTKLLVIWCVAKEKAVNESVFGQFNQAIDAVFSSGGVK